MNNTGALFFARDLRRIFLHTSITCGLFKGTEQVHILDRKEFNEDVVSSIDNTMKFLKQHLMVRYEMTGQPQRREVPEIPFDALREAVINAAAHRNYLLDESNITVFVFDDRVEVASFGALPKGLKPAQLGARSVRRNKLICELLRRIEYMEEMGTGVRKMRRLIAEAGLPPIRTSFSTFVALTFQRPGWQASADTHSVEGTRPPRKRGMEIGTEIGAKFGAEFGAKFGASENTACRLVEILGRIRAGRLRSARFLAAEFGVSSRMVEKDIQRLKELGLLAHEGHAQWGKYVLTEKGSTCLRELVKEME